MTTIYDIGGTTNNSFILNNKISFLQGDENPNNVIGNNGDVYFQSNGTIWTKSNGIWTSIESGWSDLSNPTEDEMFMIASRSSNGVDIHYLGKNNIAFKEWVISELNRVQTSTLPPVGSFYTQYANNTGKFVGSESPNILYPNTYWQQYFNTEGVFFRTEGGNANEARTNGVQGDAIRNIVGECGNYGNGVGSEYYSTGAMYVRNYDGVSGESEATQGVSSIYGFDASRVVPTGSENRPINRLIRVWKRIS